MISEMIRDTYADGKVVKVSGDYNYRRYNAVLDTFEALAYAGAGWSWTDNGNYYRRVDV